MAFHSSRVVVTPGGSHLCHSSFRFSQRLVGLSSNGEGLLHALLLGGLLVDLVVIVALGVVIVHVVVIAIAIIP